MTFFFCFIIIKPLRHIQCTASWWPRHVHQENQHNDIEWSWCTNRLILNALWCVHVPHTHKWSVGTAASMSQNLLFCLPHSGFCFRDAGFKKKKNYLGNKKVKPKCTLELILWSSIVGIFRDYFHLHFTAAVTTKRWVEVLCAFSDCKASLHEDKRRFI